MGSFGGSPFPLPPLQDAGGPPPLNVGMDANPQGMSALDPAAEGLAQVIADAIRSFQAGQAQDAMQHPLVQALLAPQPDPAMAMGGGSFAPAPPPAYPDPSQAPVSAGVFM